LLLGGEQVMPTRDRTCALTKSLETKHFAANRTDQLFAGSVSRTSE
jgi:hypothetical protein